MLESLCKRRLRVKAQTRLLHRYYSEVKSENERYNINRITLNNYIEILRTHARNVCPIYRKIAHRQRQITAPWWYILTGHKHFVIFGRVFH